MLRVMVVEDEPPILKSICTLLSEYRSWIEIVHTAINGERALEYLRKHPVDLVFSDIKMPIMGGLDLAKHLHEDYPATTMVIISGFQEFEFARTAIRYGVKSYLLKPISREGLYEVLEEVSNEVRKSRIEELRHMVRQMVVGVQQDTAHFETRHMQMLLYCEGAFPLSSDEMGLPQNRMRNAPTVEKYLATLLQPDDIALVVPGRSLAEKVVLFECQNLEKAQNVAQRLFNSLQSASSVPITIMVGQQLVPLGQMAAEYAALRQLLRRQVCLFHSAVLWASTPQQKNQQPDFTDWNRAMLLAVKTRSREEILAVCAQLGSLLKAQPVTQFRVLSLLEKLIVGCFGEVLTLAQIGDLKAEVQFCVSHAETPAQFGQELADVLYEWSQTDVTVGAEEENTLSEAIAEYLRANYKASIGNRELADEFKIPAAQISKKFKEYFGLSISEYTNQFRIELAQTMMREDRKVRIKEVALEVGYADQYYFSKTFKKIVGIWPTEYVEQLEQ
ncbi:MAG: response regulator [Oscillospiraceae bacterium]